MDISTLQHFVGKSFQPDFESLSTWSTKVSKKKWKKTGVEPLFSFKIIHEETFLPFCEVKKISDVIQL